MRKPNVPLFFALLGALLLVVACKKDKEGGQEGPAGAPPASAAVEGAWKVLNPDGQETGQTVTITADHITWETPNLSPSEGKATFTKKDDRTIEADWYGSTMTLEVVDADSLKATRAGADWKLVRQ